MKIHVLEHDPVESPGAISDWAAARGYPLRSTLLDRGGVLPGAEEVDVLAIMGGPMNVYDHRDHPWLVPEKAFITAAIEAGKPVLGICLGAQLIADVLGGKVFQNAEREIGWWPVRMLDRDGPFANFPETLTVMQWHGDTFTLPPDARRVAESEGCANQAFVVGDRVVGVQFHLEMQALDPAVLRAWCGGEPKPGRYVQPLEQIGRTPEDLPATHAALFALLDALASRAGRGW
jgi:GMP synthase-like glutamine amidotransferase